MTDDFENHCWKDIVSPELLEIYASYKRKVFVGPNPALLAVDLYEVVYAGGPQPPHMLAKTHPNSCGEYAYAAIEPTKRLFAAARAAGLPVFYSTTRRAAGESSQQYVAPPSGTGRRSARRISRSGRNSSPSRTTW